VYPIDCDTLIRYLTDAKLKQWHGRSHASVQHWLAQVHLVNTLVKGRDNFTSDEVLFFLFRKTFSIMPDLDSVSPVLIVEKYASNGEKYSVIRDLTFAEYHTAIASAYTKLDCTCRNDPSGHLHITSHHMAYDFFEASTDVHQLVHMNP